MKETVKGALYEMRNNYGKLIRDNYETIILRMDADLTAKEAEIAELKKNQKKKKNA